jgi:thiamine-monophosphate kinase
MAAPPEADTGDDEFAIIARYFAPLATDPAARGLLDDVALLDAGGALVITADAIVEGVHFPPDDPLDLVARKAIRVNVSDVVAKGARPLGYVLTLIWPDARAPAQIAALAAGLAHDQRVYAAPLLGGDTARTPGPLCIAITLFGAPLGRTPARADAAPGEDVWVSGTIGDGGLGLDVRRGGAGELDAPARAALERRYLLPEPRLEYAGLIARVAQASCDVSDGLLADAGRIADASGVAIDIALNALPLSPPASAWAQAREDRLVRLATAGDDYEILFTATASAREAIAAAADGPGARLTRIGAVREGRGARLIGASGPVDVAIAGFAHRLGGRPR